LSDSFGFIWDLFRFQLIAFRNTNWGDRNCAQLIKNQNFMSTNFDRKSFS
jgi:hypothetical protein